MPIYIAAIPIAIGPYSPAIVILFKSGQPTLYPPSHESSRAGSVQQVISRLRTALHEEGGRCSEDSDVSEVSEVSAAWKVDDEDDDDDACRLCTTVRPGGAAPPPHTVREACTVQPIQHALPVTSAAYTILTNTGIFITYHT